MWIFLMVIGVFVVWAVVATLTAVAHDGYRALPTRIGPAYDFEGKRNQFWRDNVGE